MAEFQEVIRQYKRMCCGKACSDCDFYKFKTSLNYQMACLRFLKEYPVEAEALVMNWAEEHPVVYPTWYEFLTERYHKAWEAIGCDNISADIAEKLDIEPKEG